MIALSPAHHRQKCRRSEERQQAPVIGRAGRRMATAAFLAQLRYGASNYACESEWDMDAHDHCQEDGVGRGNLDPENDGGLACHAKHCALPMRLYCVVLAAEKRPSSSLATGRLHFGLAAPCSTSRSRSGPSFPRVPAD